MEIIVLLLILFSVWMLGVIANGIAVFQSFHQNRINAKLTKKELEIKNQELGTLKRRAAEEELRRTSRLKTYEASQANPHETNCNESNAANI